MLLVYNLSYYNAYLFVSSDMFRDNTNLVPPYCINACTGLTLNHRKLNISKFVKVSCLSILFKQPQVSLIPINQVKKPPPFLIVQECSLVDTVLLGCIIANNVSKTCFRY